MVELNKDDKLFGQILVNIKLRNIQKLRNYNIFITKKAFSTILDEADKRMPLIIPNVIKEELPEFVDYKQAINCIDRVILTLKNIQSFLDNIILDKNSDTILINGLLAFYLNLSIESFIKIRSTFETIKIDNPNVSSYETLNILISNYQKYQSN